jgi:hypothetical protein
MEMIDILSMSGGKTSFNGNFTIVEESKEEDVSFNTRSNIFSVNSPI